MKSSICKRSVVLGEHKTSVSLEDAFWQALKDIARRKDRTVAQLIASIDAERNIGNLSSAVRLFILDHYQGSSASESVRGSGDLAQLTY
jgi:predicted DNA-binding ribbon-helix-helix protein